MFELLTLYAHVEYMEDEAYNKNGYIVDLTTVKDPEYSKDLRDLIQDCLHPTPRNRIRLDILRLSINVYRSRIRDKYEQSNDDEQARFKAENRLYYVKNEINKMPPGNWEPYFKKKRPQSEQFPAGPRIRYPLFSDGPEPGAKEGKDIDDGNDDDGNDDEAGAPGGKQQKGTSSQFPDLP